MILLPRQSDTEIEGAMPHMRDLISSSLIGIGDSCEQSGRRISDLEWYYDRSLYIQTAIAAKGGIFGATIGAMFAASNPAVATAVSVVASAIPITAISESAARYTDGFDGSPTAAALLLAFGVAAVAVTAAAIYAPAAPITTFALGAVQWAWGSFHIAGGMAIGGFAGMIGGYLLSDAGSSIRHALNKVSGGTLSAVGRSAKRLGQRICRHEKPNPAP